jgi:predicted MPP superfamily phosphohydrolase
MRRLLFFLLAAGLALGLFGWATAVQDPVVVRYRLAVAGLSRPLRIVQLSDIHFSWVDMPKVRLARIIAQANALHPDVIVLTGDYAFAKLVDWPHIRLEDAIYPLAGLHAPLGVWAAPGNHDEPYWIRVVMGRTPVRLLASATADIGPVTLLGIDDLVLGTAPEAGLARAAAGASRAKPLIAFAHEPDFWRVLPANVAVLIAGHTHGGQIAPFGLAPLNDFYARFRRGAFRNAAGQQMVVSSGLGTSYVPLRIGVPPEIVEITLVPAQTLPPAPHP